jgi:hypothetical protein
MKEDRFAEAYKRTPNLTPPPPKPETNGKDHSQEAFQLQALQEVLVHILKHLYYIKPPKEAKPATEGMPLDYKFWIHLTHFMWNVTWKDAYVWCVTHLKRWTISKYPRFRSWFTCLISKRVSKEVEEERAKICALCPLLDDSGERCNGGKPPGQERGMKIKNHKQGFYCPARQHQGEYPVYHNLRFGDVKIKKAPCSGCTRKGNAKEKAQ